MSVQRNQYLGYGYMVDFKQARQHLIDTLGLEGYEEIADQYHDSAFNDEIVEVHGCSMIEDGMGGKYTFFGKIYAKSSDHEVLESTRMSTPTERDQIITEHEFRRLFADSFSVEPGVHLITHYR